MCYNFRFLLADIFRGKGLGVTYQSGARTAATVTYLADLHPWINSPLNSSSCMDNVHQLSPSPQLRLCLEIFDPAPEVPVRTHQSVNRLVDGDHTVVRQEKVADEDTHSATKRIGGLR